MAVRPRVLSFYAGPGTGKSTLAAALFAHLKMLGANVELVTEYAKDATWERRGEKVFRAQEYLFGKQHFRLSRVSDEVDFVITDSPVMLCHVYTADDFPMPSIRNVFTEAYRSYDNIDIFLARNKPYNPKGRNQTEAEAKALDAKILDVIKAENPDVYVLDYGRNVIENVVEILEDRGWIPKRSMKQLQELLSYHEKCVIQYKNLIALNELVTSTRRSQRKQ